MREAKNTVFIEGILSEINLEERVYEKNGVNVNSITGHIVVRVETEINKEPKVLEIPVYLFQNEYTKMGKNNPIFENNKNIKDSFVSIAACGDVNVADKIRISTGKIQMNEYWKGEEALISYPRIYATFVNRVRTEDFKPAAKFQTEMVVKNIIDEVDKDGVETGRLKVEGVVPGWGDRVSIIPYVAQAPGVVNGIRQYWQLGDTVEAIGNLNFSTETQIIQEKIGFGEVVEKKRTHSVSELVITGGNDVPLSDELTYDIEDIKRGLTEREIYLQELKNKSSEKKANFRHAPTKSSFANDFGF